MHWATATMHLEALPGVHPHKRLEHTSLCIVRFNHKADAVILAGRHFLGVASDQRTHNNVFLCEFLGVASTTRPKWRAVPFR